MFQKILAAVDGSEREQGVFDLAVDVARLSGARLYVMRVVLIPPEFPAAAAGSPADPLVSKMAAGAMQDLSRMIAGAPDDVSMQPPIVRLGVPWKVILDIAEERDVDLIVLGSHGYHGWDRVLGTTAGRVANIAERNVLVVHERRPRTTAPPKDGDDDPGRTARGGSGETGTQAKPLRRMHRFRSFN
jgi:nucleotide-binding universal stress UspA family protein